MFLQSSLRFPEQYYKIELIPLHINPSNKKHKLKTENIK